MIEVFRTFDVEVMELFVFLCFLVLGTTFNRSGFDSAIFHLCNVVNGGRIGKGLPRRFGGIAIYALVLLATVVCLVGQTQRKGGLERTVGVYDKQVEAKLWGARISDVESTAQNTHAP